MKMLEALVIQTENSKVTTACPHSAVPEKDHTHPMDGHWKFLNGRGVLKVKILEAKYEAKLEFPRGRGEIEKKLPWEDYRLLFSGTAHYMSVVLSESSRLYELFVSKHGLD